MAFTIKNYEPFMLAATDLVNSAPPPLSYEHFMLAATDLVNPCPAPPPRLFPRANACPVVDSVLGRLTVW